MADRIIAFLVNYNRCELLQRAIDSLRVQTRQPDEILVIDNGSTDNSVAAVRARDDAGIAVIQVGENLGSSGGFQRGVEEGLARGATHVLILDSDVALAADCVERLRDAMKRDTMIGAVGPKVYHWDSATLLQELGGWIDWGLADLRRSHWRHDEALYGVVARDQEVDYVPACCLLTTGEVLREAGNFDPGWFLYWDDVDWCDRVRATGRRITVATAARVQHFGGGANKRNLVPVYYGWRNRLIFFRRRTAAERRGATLQAFFDDYLLAKFTCRALGLPRTAAMMELGVEDALAGVSGRKDFCGTTTELDAPSALGSIAGEAVSVHHIIGSATSELAARPGVVLVDRFGKRMAAKQAWELRQQFDRERASELGPLLARASAK